METRSVGEDIGHYWVKNLRYESNRYSGYES